MQEVSRQVIRPTPQECAQNPRARSAKLRWAIRGDGPAHGARREEEEA